MRVVAGELGGRRLTSRRGDRAGELRPTGERVREALFSILGEVDGMSVLDLFAGTGAVGIEAISRGAAAATFVDRRADAVEANLKALAIEARSVVARGDAISFLRRDLGVYDLVFCDPPYRLARRLGDDLDSLLRPRITSDSRVIVESSPKQIVELSLPLLDERRYGSSLIRIHGAEQDG